MCQFTFSDSRRKYCLLMAILAISIVVCVFVIVSIERKASGFVDHGCQPNSMCVPAAECPEHSDFSYSCGGGKELKVCCKSKANDITNYYTNKHINNYNKTTREALLPKNCGLVPGKDRISNGINATMGEFPWMALLGYKVPNIPFEQYLCGGSIISNRYILTAAHCITNDSMAVSSVVLGELNLETQIDCESDGETTICADKPEILGVEKIIPHPQYNKHVLKNDIGLIRLNRTITKYTDFIQPICLPFELKTDKNYFLTKEFTIAGWGKTASSMYGVTSVLQYARVRAWDFNRCNTALPARVKPVSAQQICATGNDFQEACRGDSGGPLTDFYVDGVDIRNVQIGIVSFKSLDTCGTEEVPTVFTKIDRYLDWIVSQLKP